MINDGVRISSQRTGTTVRVTVSGELDIATSPELRYQLAAQLADHAEIVVLDLAEVSFIDTSGLHALLDAATLDGNRLRIIPSPQVLYLIKLASVHDHLQIIDATSYPR